MIDVDCRLLRRDRWGVYVMSDDVRVGLDQSRDSDGEKDMMLEVMVSKTQTASFALTTKKKNACAYLGYP